MSVEIEPTELGFRRPFTAEVGEVLRIRNPNSMPVAFKVKTTAPKQYCVRPNSGRIEPDRVVEVTVLLQAMKQDPPADYKCRDKFLVQSVPITGDKEFQSIQNIWDGVEKTAVEERKIRVSFLPPEDPDALAPTITPARQSTTNGFDTTFDASPPAYASPHEVSRATTNGVAAAEEPFSPQKPDVTSSGSSAPIPLAASLASSSAGSTAAAAPSTTPRSSGITTTTANDKDATIAALTARLAEAEALMASLRKDGGLRQRKGLAATTTPGTSEKAAHPSDTTATQAQLKPTTRQGTEGVPVRVVALLCLICFLLAYFFF
ncbi:integral er membrane protein [Niveomyces insectorum RCEF 264]|uniref:Integral er membrane protein n=1 Tax=Niveomyces insectorum RCEF 264 TaxID=1081102 RepID=A0A167ZBC7_9HYPO|nr:integral er membrane protein [Niveomyces insectorum RCEF 264]